MRDGRLLGLRSPGALHTLVEDDAVLVRWLPLLDGSRSLASIAELSGVPLTTVREVALDLYAAGLLAEAEPSEVEVPALVFYDHARASGLIWAETTALLVPM